ncbi:response regulator [uncultured Roseobacter sp.]|uniref:response regulator n=1 Tax=uncultured Roseobacter sp. TaxID=114847 RepID=UPI0026098042|nr:response regulator [uncultured Roseobacter sp.]
MEVDGVVLQKALLIDDDTVTNLMHQRLIRRSGLIAQVDVATDGEAALRHLDESDRMPDLIVLDINMPGMNGFEFLEAYVPRLASEGSGNPLIAMVSTSEAREDREQAMANPNVHCFINKPLNEAAIRDLVAACQEAQG